MKRKFLGLLAFVAVGLAVPGHAYDYWSLIKDKTVVVTSSSTFTGIASTSTILIKLSDTTNYPHKMPANGVPRQLNITSIELKIDKLPASTCTIRFGVVNFVDASSGSVTWFKQFPQILNNSSANNNVSVYTTGEYYYKLKVVPLIPTGPAEGATPFILSNIRTNGSTIYQTDVNLPNPVGNAAAPGVGDMVMQADFDTTKTYVITVEVAYHAE